MIPYSSTKVADFINDIQSLSADSYEMVIKLRDSFFSCDANLTEDIKYGGLVFFKGKDLISGIFCYKQHISIEFSHGSKLTDPNSVLEGKGKARRHIKVKTMHDIEEKNVTRYIQKMIEIS